jgi:NADPH-dependent curcumin reductase CurA
MTELQNVVNRRWLLKQYPEGIPTLDNWTMDAQPVPDPGPGQVRGADTVAISSAIRYFCLYPPVGGYCLTSG